MRMKRKTNSDILYLLEAALTNNSEAKIKFGNLSSEQKDRILDYINSAQTPDEREQRTKLIANSLNDKEKMWFYD